MAVVVLRPLGLGGFIGFLCGFGCFAQPLLGLAAAAKYVGGGMCCNVTGRLAPVYGGGKESKAKT